MLIAVSIRRQAEIVISFLVVSMLVSTSSIAQSENANSVSLPNRIEYHDFNWQAFNTPAFHIYFLKGADSLAAFISKEVLPAKEFIEKRMGGNISIPQAIIIYPSLSEQYESSVGIQGPDALTIPTYVAKGGRVVLHYEGSYTDLKTQLYAALARSGWEKELGQSSNISAQVKGGFKSDPIPYWYKEGAIKYFSEGWPLNREEDFRRIFLRDTPVSFYVLAIANPSLTGAAFCYFLSTTTRQDAPLQVMYHLRKGKSLERALRLVIKQPADILYSACMAWYYQRFNNVRVFQLPAEIGSMISSGTSRDTAILPNKKTISLEMIPLPFKSSKKGTVLSYRLDPSGRRLALTVAFPGYKRSVFVCDLQHHLSSTVATYRLPTWLKNHEADSYPLLNWISSSSELLVTYPQKGSLTITRLSCEGNLTRKTALPLIDGVSNVTPLGDTKYLLSAWLRGQSDLVIFDEKTHKYSSITNDPADDVQPMLLPEAASPVHLVGYENSLQKKATYFTSVRRGDKAYGQDTLTMQHGIYAVVDKKVRPILTDTIAYNSYLDPVLVDAQHLLLRASIKGRNRLAVLSLSEAGKTVSNNGNPSSVAHSRLSCICDYVFPYQYLPQSRSIAFFRRVGDSILITSQSFDSLVKEASKSSLSTDTVISPWLADYQARAAGQQKEDSVLQAAKAAGGPSFLDGMSMIGSAGRETKGQKNRGDRQQADFAALQYAPSKARPYMLQLYSAYFSAQVNNDYFINRYQPYSAFQGSFKFPNIGGMVQSGLSDLFEHHHLSFAYRLPAGSQGSMFFAKYGNTAKRLDWSLAYYRNVESLHPDPVQAWVDADGRHYPSVANVKTHYYELTLSYPLSYYAAVGSSLFMRQDRTVFLATDIYSLTFPALTEIWAGLPLWAESKHLNPTLAGLYRGWQGRITTDVFKSVSGQDAFVGAVKAGAEWHKPLYKYITLVLKGQAGFSGGDKKILYNLGGG